MSVLKALERFFRRSVGERLIVAFSGGPDSTALLWGLKRVAAELRLEIVAAHLDHRLDPDSGRRARRARQLAEELAVPFVSEHLSTVPVAESVEAYARRQRYAFLERLAESRDARFVVTAHHADDQAETVLLRMLYGSGWEGLAGIAGENGRLVRPLLDLPRRTLLSDLEASGLESVDDPTNVDLSVPRNRVRHHVLPLLRRRDPRIVERLCALARSAAGAGRRSEELLAARLEVRSLPDGRGAAIDRVAFEALPSPLEVPALALLARRAGAAYPAHAPARHELLRQLEHARGDDGSPGDPSSDGPRIGCDCGEGWRFEADTGALRMLRPTSKELAPKPIGGDFAYTLKVPGVVEIPEIGLRVHLERGIVSPWMFRGRADRTALACPLADGDRVEIRNRRPGDRIQPLGGNVQVRIKDLLIARRVPRHERDRLPLLVVDGRIAWVPGVTIDERFRLTDETSTWIAKIESHELSPPAAA